MYWVNTEVPTKILTKTKLHTGQAFLMDKFFDGEFLTFGLEVMRLTEEDEDRRIDPMIRIFPRMTKCTFRKGGPSWGLETHDALCTLEIWAKFKDTYAWTHSVSIAFKLHITNL